MGLDQTAEVNGPQNSGCRRMHDTQAQHVISGGTLFLQVTINHCHSA